jgi:hypothetical protein
MYPGVPIATPLRVLGPASWVPDHLGDAEIEQFRQIGIITRRDDEDVSGFEIAVDDAARVGVVERVADLHDEVERAVRRESATSLVEVHVERFAIEERDHHEELAVLERAEVVHAQDLVVLEQRGGLGLAAKPPADHRVPGIRRQQHLDHLERVRQLLVAGEVDHAHASLGELLLDAEREDRLSDQRIGWRGLDPCAHVNRVASLAGSHFAEIPLRYKICPAELERAELDRT